MGSRGSPPLRSLPRVFVHGASADAPIDLPSDEVEKIRKVLRLGTGDQIAVLPNDGTLIRCELQGRKAVPIEVLQPEVEPDLRLTVAQALPKGDKLEAIVRSCTEIGASEFLFFPSDRTVVRWDQKKAEDRLRRLRMIAQEAAELSFRTRLPSLRMIDSLSQVLEAYPDAAVLSEVEGLERRLQRKGQSMAIVAGPEGGWSAEELRLIGARGVTLGPRVLRVDHAAPAAAAILLLGQCD